MLFDVIFNVTVVDLMVEGNTADIIVFVDVLEIYYANDGIVQNYHIHYIEDVLMFS